MQPTPIGVWDSLLRLLLAFVLGGIIGVEREMRDQPAGFRTHVILAIGAALLGIISINAARHYGNMRVGDPARIAAQVVSGIGFLGAGAIFKIGVNVRGLTTAATLWSTAAIGLAAGMGCPEGAIFTTALVMFSLLLLRRVERLLLATKPKLHLYVSAYDSPSIMGEIEKTLNSLCLKIDFVEVNRDPEVGEVEINMVVRPLPGCECSVKTGGSSLASSLMQLEAVHNVEIR